MSEDFRTLCENRERAGFESGFRWGIGVTVVFAVLVGLVRYLWRAT